MNLTQFFPSQKPRVSLKTAFKKMRASWLSGTIERFDLKLAKILECSLDEARKVRNEWLALDFVYFDERGLITWRGAF